MKKPNPKPNPSQHLTPANTQHPNPSTYLLKLTKRLFQNEFRPILLRLIKISFLKVKERSRALENKKTNSNPNPSQHPTHNQSTYFLKLTKRPFLNESRLILLRLMKISFLKVKERRSRALE